MVIWFAPYEMVQSDGYGKWAERHHSLIKRFARNAVERKFGSAEQLEARMHLYPEVAYYVIQDWMRYNNAQKLQMCLDELFTGSKIIIIVGDRGEGKTALAWSAADRATKPPYNRGVYTSHIDEAPPIAELVKAPTDCPENGIYIMDEAHIGGLHARRGQTNQALAILNQLSVLRHGNRTFILITQDASFIDTNAKSLYNVAMFKKLPLNASKGSSSLIFEGFDVMLPHIQQVTYVQSRGLRFQVQFGLAPWWSSKWSESFGMLSDPEIARNIIIERSGMGQKGPAIKTYLESRRFPIEIAEIEHIIVQHTKTVNDKIYGREQKQGESIKALDAGAVRRVDYLIGGVCEDWKEVLATMKDEGYEGIDKNWVIDTILKLKMNTKNPSMSTA